MAAYKGLETSTSLLIAYESLALAYKSMYERQESYSTLGMTGSVPSAVNPYNNFSHGLALLVINASIIEGTLRSILSSRVLDDIQIASVEGLRKGQTGPDFPEKLMRKFLSDLELTGGWQQLKSAYQTYLGDKIETKINNSDLLQTIEVLFTLRNIFAHGTSLIKPSEVMGEHESEEYPYNWQNKLHPLQVYLKKQFRYEDIFDNLAEYGMPEHFFAKTQEFFLLVETGLAPMPLRVSKTLDMLKGMSFGYVA